MALELSVTKACELLKLQGVPIPCAELSVPQSIDGWLTFCTDDNDDAKLNR